jgi:signal transduction histidine kinase/DNA-binding response OmpR family regulator/ABC-type xylose transport system substrate-binding protein
MRTIKTLCFFLSIATLLALVSTCNVSCTNTLQQNSYTIGFSQCTGLDLWRRTMLEEMKTELSLHPGVDFLYTDAKGDSHKQIAQVSAMLDKLDLLIISPNEAEPLTAIVEEAYRKGIPVIVIDRKTTSSLYTAYIGADNYELGKIAGNYLGSLTKDKINLIEITGLPGSSPASERSRGFVDGIRNFPNIHVRHKIRGNWVRPDAKLELVKLGGKLDSINAIFAHNDDMAFGSRMVFKSLYPNKRMTIIGVDAIPGVGGGMQMVFDKSITASLVYPTLGKEAILTAFKILNHENFRKENILPSLVVDSTNVRLMKMQYNKINSQRNDILKQQTLLAEQQLVYKSQQTVLNIIVITLILAIISGGLAFYILMENRKIIQNLAIKNQEILIKGEQLQEMSARAEEATESRLNFFTNVTHEFRTPITLMLLPLQDMLNNARVVEVTGNALKMVNQNAYRLLRLVNQLIDYRKIEIDKMTIKASENNLVAFTRDVIESFKLQAKKSKVQLYLIPTEKDIPVWFDVNMMDKVFFNLISNAIKFIPDEGAVKVYLSKEAGCAHIEIQDNGIGMTPEEAELIFDQFYQADNHPRVGSGIGLSLTKEIVKCHYGKISVATQKWKGSTFTIELPLGVDHLQDEEKINIKNEWPEMDQESLICRTDLEYLTFEKEPEFQQPLKEFSILVIEDNPDLLNYLVQKLNVDFQIYTASNGNDAVVQALERVPDLILTDVVLPGLSGKTVTERIKTDLRTSHIPVIMLTAQSSDEQRISGLETLADLYISKPFQFNFLLAAINNLIQNRKILKEHFISDMPNPQKSSVSTTLDKKFLNDFSSIVEKNLSNENFSVDDLCRNIGVSRIQLYRKVKALMGCAVNEYILNRRLKKAAYLLTNEQLSVSEVAYMVGFSSANYFSTAFKLKYNCPPKEFKNMHKIL